MTIEPIITNNLKTSSPASASNWALYTLRATDSFEDISEIKRKRAKSNGSLSEFSSIMFKEGSLSQSLKYPLQVPFMSSQGVSTMSQSRKHIKTFVVLTQDEDGFIVAECPSMPGCMSQGQTREEAIKNIKEAIELCREVRQELNMPEFEVVELEV